MTDQEIMALVRYRPSSLTQRLVEGLSGRAICDQCHRRMATCTVPIFDVGYAAALRRDRPGTKRKEFWCSQCRANAFSFGQEHAWGDDRGRFGARA